MASMARAESRPPFSPDAYLQDWQDQPLIPNDNSFTLSGNCSRTMAAVAADIRQISYLESQHLALSGNGSSKCQKIKSIEMQQLESMLSVFLFGLETAKLQLPITLYKDKRNVI